MKRLIALLLLAVLLCGCAEKDADTTEPSDTVVEEQTQNDGFPGLGGTMPEMTFNTSDGKTVTLSELLEQRKLVVLNFWFEDCKWCLKEFPAMELAYHRYRDEIEIVALNPVDSLEAIQAFKEKYSLSFPLVSCPRSWTVEMGVRGFPTSIFIDRDGVVCLIHSGAIPNPQTFYRVFDAFTADDYERKVYGSISELTK